MARRRVTIPDLARELGVSVGTVSNALNGTGRISDTTRERVLAAAARLGYRKNQTAAALRTGGIGIVSLHIPPRTNDLHFYMEFAFGLSARLAESGVDVLLSADPRTGPARVRPVDAAVVVDWTSDMSAPPALLAAGVPVIAAEGVPSPALTPDSIIAGNHAEVVAEAVDRAIRCGARRPVVLLPQAPHDSNWQQQIAAGFAAACERHGATSVVERFPIGITADQLLDLVDAVQSRHDPDCLVFGGERLAGIAHTARGFGLPGSDIPWIVSCSGDPVSELPSSALTVIDGQPRRFGDRCGEVVLDVLTEHRLPSVLEWPMRVRWASHWCVPEAEPTVTPPGRSR